MLTPKQLECYRAMEAYKARNGVIPSYRELMEILGLNSLSGIHRMVAGMEKRGAIQRLRGQARAIRLLPLD